MAWRVSLATCPARDGTVTTGQLWLHATAFSLQEVLEDRRDPRGCGWPREEAEARDVSTVCAGSYRAPGAGGDSQGQDREQRPTGCVTLASLSTCHRLACSAHQLGSCVPHCSWGQLALALGHGLGLWVPGHRNPVSAPVIPSAQQGGEGQGICSHQGEQDREGCSRGWADTFAPASGSFVSLVTLMGQGLITLGLSALSWPTGQLDFTVHPRGCTLECWAPGAESAVWEQDCGASLPCACPAGSPSSPQAVGSRPPPTGPR